MIINHLCISKCGRAIIYPPWADSDRKKDTLVWTNKKHKKHAIPTEDYVQYYVYKYYLGGRPCKFFFKPKLKPKRKILRYTEGNVFFFFFFFGIVIPGVSVEKLNWMLERARVEGFVSEAMTDPEKVQKYQEAVASGNSVAMRQLSKEAKAQMLVKPHPPVPSEFMPHQLMNHTS